LLLLRPHQIRIVVEAFSIEDTGSSSETMPSHGQISRANAGDGVVHDSAQGSAGAVIDTDRIAAK
jgi:hypothetical protein